MKKVLFAQQKIFIFGLPLLLVIALIALVKSPLFVLNPSKLALGITIDLLFTIPLVYFFLIRKTTVPKITAVTLCILGMVICTVTLPEKHQGYLNLFKTWILPVVELSILSYVMYNLRKAIKRFRKSKQNSLDFFSVLKETCYSILPKIAVIPVVTEIAVMYYGFWCWKKRKLAENEFSYHKNSGTITLLVAIILIVGIETVVLHMLLVKWSIIAAWILTFLSVYSAIQLFGFLKSMLKRPIAIEDQTLYLRYGIMGASTIDLKNIASVEISSKDIEKNEYTQKLSFLGELESHNIVIHLKKENTLTRLYGFTKKYSTIALYVDDKFGFKKALDTNSSC